MRTASALLAVVVSAGVVHADPPVAPSENPAPAASNANPAPAASNANPAPTAPCPGTTGATPSVDPFATNIHVAPLSTRHVAPFAANAHITRDPALGSSGYREPAPEPGAARRTTAKSLAFAGIGMLASSLLLSAYERHDYNYAVDTGDIGRANRDYDIVHYGATGMFVAGVAAIGTALVLRATLPEKHTVIAPAVAPGQAGFVLARGF